MRIERRALDGGTHPVHRSSSLVDRFTKQTHLAGSWSYQAQENAEGSALAGSVRSEVNRIYWFELKDERTFVVGHVGRHLPDRTT